MRNWITILLLMIAVVGGVSAGTEKGPKPSLDLQVQQLIGTLREQIIPPVGTAKAEVDKMYGEPREVPQLGVHGKGDPSDYPMHVYQLLDPQGNAEFRAVMGVTYRDGKVYRASINHERVTKGRWAGVQSPQVIAEIECENRWVLVDLLEIYNKYKVTKASWNASAANAGAK